MEVDMVLRHRKKKRYVPEEVTQGFTDGPFRDFKSLDSPAKEDFVNVFKHLKQIMDHESKQGHIKVCLKIRFSLVHLIDKLEKKYPEDKDSILKEAKITSRYLR
jgi:hypothetical protein